VKLSPSDIESFVVRISLEEAAEDGRDPTWSGHVTHVASGERRYLRRLDDIAAFIRPYLERMGVGVPPHGRARTWLERCRRLWTRQP